MNTIVIKWILAVSVALLIWGCEARNDMIPPPGFIANPIEGRSLYIRHCEGCHGRVLEGSRQGPPLIHEFYHPNHHSDLAFYMAAKQGVRQHHWDFGDMPPIEISPQEMGHIIAYVREMQHKAGIF